MAERRGQDERRLAALVLMLDVRALLDQEAREVLVAALHGHAQRRVGRRIGGGVQVDVRVVLLARLCLYALLDEVGSGRRERRWRRR